MNRFEKHCSSQRVHPAHGRTFAKKYSKRGKQIETRKRLITSCKLELTAIRAEIEQTENTGKTLLKTQAREVRIERLESDIRQHENMCDDYRKDLRVQLNRRRPSLPDRPNRFLVDESRLATKRQDRRMFRAFSTDHFIRKNVLRWLKYEPETRYQNLRHALHNGSREEQLLAFHRIRSSSHPNISRTDQSASMVWRSVHDGKRNPLEILLGIRTAQNTIPA